jgi:hypothetical protein
MCDRRAAARAFPGGHLDCLGPAAVEGSEADHRARSQRYKITRRHGQRLQVSHFGFTDECV